MISGDTLYEWWEAIHKHAEDPSTPSGIPIDPPILHGCSAAVREELEYMDYKMFLRAQALLEALTLMPKNPTEVDFSCRVCGKHCDVASKELGTFCPEHCPDHNYIYSREERRHYCGTCGQEPPDDWFQ